MYTEKDLINFGKYLLSKKRANRLKKTVKENPNALLYKEKKIHVFDADLANWSKNINPYKQGV